MKQLQTCLWAGALLLSNFAANAQVDVKVKLDTKHEVGGVSDFGRERHITVHSSLGEGDWVGEEDKLEYLLNDLDAYFGRDNGTASWIFQSTNMDPNKANYPDLGFMATKGNSIKAYYHNKLKERGFLKYKDKAQQMICGTNPHPTYPTYNYNHMVTGDDGVVWMPREIEASRDWVVQYLDNYFVDDISEDGELRPMYWEVINEPDMVVNNIHTWGGLNWASSSWEALWEYSSIVAKGVKERLGYKAPKVGGMTWGLLDMHKGDYQRTTLEDAYKKYGNTAGDQAVKDEMAANYGDSKYWAGGFDKAWYQWDVLYKGFMDAAGKDMDFYSVHMYDWPSYKAHGGNGYLRAGMHSEAMLELIEWYDVYKNGVENRKPVVISEFGAVQGAWVTLAHEDRFDWENLKPFNSMMMQFLRRPDYLVKTMPFTPIKATWGDGTAPYHYKLMRDDDKDGTWEWSPFIKWYELWAEVEGTRVETASPDLDIQVDCYVNGSDVFLILNSMETTSTTINLTGMGLPGSPSSIRKKHLYAINDDQTVVLDDETLSAAPSSVTLNPDATMILKYSYASNVENQISNVTREYKYYGESLGTNHRLTLAGRAAGTVNVNGVVVPADKTKSSAKLMLTASVWAGWDKIDALSINGTAVTPSNDWIGQQASGAGRLLVTMEIPFDVNLLKENNTINVTFLNGVDIAVANIVVTETTNANVVIPVSKVTLSTTELTINMDAKDQVKGSVWPQAVSNKTIIYQSMDESIAKVDVNGVVTPVSEGKTTIKVISDADNSKFGECAVTVTNIIVLPESVTLNKLEMSVLKGNSRTLEANVAPANARDLSVSWKSSNEAIATVSKEGVVTGVSAGVVTITVTTNAASKTTSCKVTVVDLPADAASIDVEAEDFYTTDGTYDDSGVGGSGAGVIVNAQKDGISHFNGGDYFIVKFTVAEPGNYYATSLTGTIESNREMKMIFDGNQEIVCNVPNNGNWDNYVETVIPGYVSLAAGENELRIEGSTQDWLFNVDKIILRAGTGVPADVDNINQNPPTNSLVESELEGVLIFPNPVKDIVNISAPANSKYLIFNALGQVSYVGQVDGPQAQINVSALSSGVYSITVINDSKFKTIRFVKK